MQEGQQPSMCLPSGCYLQRPKLKTKASSQSERWQWNTTSGQKSPAATTPKAQQKDKHRTYRQNKTFCSFSAKEQKADINAVAKDKSGSAHEANNSGLISPAATVSAAKHKAPGYTNQCLVTSRARHTALPIRQMLTARMQRLSK